MNSFSVVGLGEVLWDILPAGPQLGGAPANFAYISSLLGHRAFVASCVGADGLGSKATTTLQNLGVVTSHLQSHPQHPTGTVQVRLDENGQAEFEILPYVAWDFLQWTVEWQQLALACDAVCFGSLAQRSSASRNTIQNFLKTTRAAAVRIFDVNFRQSFFSGEILRRSFELADIVKLNHEELPRVARAFGLGYESDQHAAALLRAEYDLDLLCVTLASAGSLLVSPDEMDDHPGFQVKVVDTVGAGDAFTAGLVHEYLRHSTLHEMNETANRLGAWVASQSGATPKPPVGGLAPVLAAFT